MRAVSSVGEDGFSSGTREESAAGAHSLSLSSYAARLESHCSAAEEGATLAEVIAAGDESKSESRVADSAI